MGIFGKMLFGIDENDKAKTEESGGVDQTEEKLVELIKRSKAVAALSVYAAAVDGSISLDEYMEIDMNVGAASEKAKLPERVVEEISGIYDKHSMTWDDVKKYLDEVSTDDLAAMSDYINGIINADSEVSEAEEQVIKQFESYVESRN